MRKILISSAIVLSLAGGAAFAATAPTAKPAPVASKATSTPVSTNPTASKASDCAKQWKAEKKHSETRKAFMAACAKA